MGENGRIGRALLVWAKIDGFLESLFGPIFLIPAKAGIHPAEGGTAFAGVTGSPTFYEIIKICVQNFLAGDENWENGLFRSG